MVPVVLVMLVRVVVDRMLVAVDDRVFLGVF